MTLPPVGKEPGIEHITIGMRTWTLKLTAVHKDNWLVSLFSPCLGFFPPIPVCH